MAIKGTLAERLLNLTRIPTQTLSNCRSYSSSVRSRIPQFPNKPSMGTRDPGENRIFRRYLQREATSHSEVSSVFWSSTMGDMLHEKLQELDISSGRIQLDGLSPPAEKLDMMELTVEDARKLLCAAQLEKAKSKLREIERSCITSSEFLKICSESCSDPVEAPKIAKKLDESAAVIVLGDVVFLRPEQVAKALHGFLFAPEANTKETATKEFEEMHKQKAMIDEKAYKLVRRELLCGLGFLVAQTLSFMRLTFWELSWDVMEPICFYVTSLYFMGGYAFFLRTSREPSFEGFYQSRFNAKQKRLMDFHKFDIEKYKELWKACHPNSSSPITSQFQNSGKGACSCSPPFLLSQADRNHC